MWCGIISLFPAMFSVLLQEGVTARAVKQGILALSFWNPRAFTCDQHSTVDDRPYGGGPGMVMAAIPIRRALKAARAAAPGPARVVYVSPAGAPFHAQKAKRFAQDRAPLIFIAGRYEGIDQRIIEHDVDEQISIGDYVLSGGELPIMVIIDALTRWLPGALGHAASASQDAFSEENGGLLDCPHYTRPARLGKETVPGVLLQGNHEKIEQWRKQQALGQTWRYRPELLEKMQWDAQSRQWLAEYQSMFQREPEN